jgi:hypothetical protein
MRKELNSTVYFAALTHYLPVWFEPFIHSVIPILTDTWRDESA